LIPLYNKFDEKLKQKILKASGDLNYFNSKMILTVIKSALITSDNVLTADERKMIVSAKKMVAIALVNDSHTNMRKVQEELERIDSLMDKLSRSSKTKFLSDTILMAKVVLKKGL
jgi:hypothetical protein